jgi:GrpB-like predicted nucleotidyltransferase (UPF0157 family)
MEATQLAGCDDAPMAKPVIVDWQPRWAGEFAEIRERLAASFGDGAIAIEHIGSTSVPGLAAKDVIDVQVSVASLEPYEPILDALAEAGMTEVPYDPPADDHVPPGWQGSSDMWIKLFASSPPGERRVHVHVRVAGSPNERYALLFRDFMRAHPEARDAWAIFKAELARIADDTQDYVEVKDPATDVVMVVAERWAAETGWNPRVS